MQNKKRKLFLLIIIFFILIPADVSLAAFNPNLIISDYEFRDYTSMTLDDVQRFLKGKNSSLATYVDPTIRVRASQLIYDNSQVTQINPKILLVTLQKEQSLITDPNPNQGQYDWAAGFGICDSCSKSDPKLQKYKGFVNQIDYAASSFRLFFDEPQNYGYPAGTVQTIDGQAVTISNAATHALYLYTPHLHGNENFANIWKDWFTTEYPDGSLLQDAESGGIYVIQNGARRPFGSKIAFASRYSLDKVIETSPEVLEAYPLGPPIKYAQYSLIRSPGGTVYLIVDDQKRGIASREVFRSIGFNPEEVVDIDQTEIDSVPEGPPITLASAYPTGGLLQDKTTGGVWYVRDGVRQAIWSRELLKVNFTNLYIAQVSPEEIEKFTLGSPVQFKDSEIIRSFDDPAVYVVSNGLKRPIVSGEVFEKLGYKWENVIMTSAKALSLHMTGDLVDIEL